MRLTTLTVTLSLTSLTAACDDKHGDDTGDDHDHSHGHDDGGHGEQTEVDGDATAGAEVYAQSCASCHGADGSGDHAPAMHEVVPHHSASDIVDVVLNGSGDMGPVLTDAQAAADVATYCTETWHE